MSPLPTIIVTSPDSMQQPGTKRRRVGSCPPPFPSSARSSYPKTELDPKDHPWYTFRADDQSLLQGDSKNMYANDYHLMRQQNTLNTSVMAFCPTAGLCLQLSLDRFTRLEISALTLLNGSIAYKAHGEYEGFHDTVGGFVQGIRSQLQECPAIREVDKLERPPGTGHLKDRWKSLVPTDQLVTALQFLEGKALTSTF